MERVARSSTAPSLTSTPSSSISSARERRVQRPTASSRGSSHVVVHLGGWRGHRKRGAFSEWKERASERASERAGVEGWRDQRRERASERGKERARMQYRWRCRMQYRRWRCRMHVRASERARKEGGGAGERGRE
eukprot:6204630-Pleurochrysis_carterae.AAC.2